MGDHDTPDIMLPEMVVHAQRKLLPDGKRHVLAVKLRNLLRYQGTTGQHVSHTLNPSQQFGYRQLRCGVRQIARRMTGHPGNRASSAQHNDLFNYF
jgi:hypothetical protein